ncbi:hypothetical protein SAMN06295967_105200 [Belliella buryatensis]|uniref:Glycosyltransferase RgtA/B/C/D-like domain-containing protein n=1 Tax=Belliella buryatensis TaxID=1500549 RepID=A0A239CRU9_9BACT|nr:hypothetical protein [Belliella buryatensis]SNS22895.1 hypothetical protein SAMN06295967_105200 [Belliella buryatensis]
MAYANHRIAKRNNLTRYENLSLQFLFIYHLLFTWIFTSFLNSHGGDAIKYWNLVADASQEAQTWMQYWGNRTFFIQWLNYLPSKFAGLNFWAGNMLYALCSFLGFRILFIYLIKNSHKDLAISWKGFLLWILLFPNIHFWTSGVGKEALLFTAACYALIGFTAIHKHYLQISLAILLAWWVRPVFGAALIPVFYFALYQSSAFKKSHKILISALVTAILLYFTYQLTIMMHLEAYDFKGLQDFISSQFLFLENFQATSEIPMGQYNLFEKLIALFFRPFWHEINGFWYFAAAVENTTFLLLLIFAFYKSIRNNASQIPPALIYGVLYGLILASLLIFSMNNLGIIMRMKSTYMIFLYITAAFIIIPNDKESNI